MNEKVSELRLKYMGKRVKCIWMDDPYHPVPPQTKGTVDHVDDIGTLHVKWDNGSTLGLVPHSDIFILI
jgi:hypothetical protein